MKICFVSFEIAPTTPGGAGAFVANTIQVLLNKTYPNYEIILLLDIPVKEYIQYEWHDKLFFLSYHRIRTYHVDELCLDIPINYEAFTCYHLWKSYRFDHALSKIIQIEKPDIVEFFDYIGPAYIALSRGLTSQDINQTFNSIRFHLTTLPIHRANPTLPDLDLLLTYGMEARALELIDRILFSSKMIREEVLTHYQISKETDLCISPLPLKRLPFIESFSLKKTSILFFGYLDFRKGADLFLSAALLLLSKHVNEHFKFYLVGGDFYKGSNGFATFRQYLEARIPSSYSDRFIITGQISHKKLGEILPTVRFAVMPSYVETFSYAAHELYAMGIPLIARNIPVFTEYFKHEENALIFDGSVEDLVLQMERLWDDEELTREITKPFDVLPPPLGDCYENLPQKNRALQKNNQLKLSLKILVLTEEWVDLNHPKFDNCTVWQLVREPDETNSPFPFLGNLWWIYDQSGNPVSVNDWRCSDLMFIVTENDIVDEQYLTKSRLVLEQNSEISFVACWKEINGNLKIYPTDAASETLIFEGVVPSRILFHTPRGSHFFDVFNNREGVFAEIGYLWKLEEEKGKGITIPEVLVRTKDNVLFAKSFRFDTAEFNFLFMNSSMQRQAKLGHYFFTNRHSLSRFDIEQISQENARLWLAELDLKLLLKKLSILPFGWIFRLRKNFRILLKRYLEEE